MARTRSSARRESPRRRGGRGGGSGGGGGRDRRRRSDPRRGGDDGGVGRRRRRRLRGTSGGADETSAAESEKEGEEMPSEEGEKDRARGDRRQRDDSEREEEEKPKMDTSHAPKKAKHENEKKEEGGESTTIEMPSDDGENGGGKSKRDASAREEEEGSGKTTPPGAVPTEEGKVNSVPDKNAIGDRAGKKRKKGNTKGRPPRRKIMGENIQYDNEHLCWTTDREGGLFWHGAYKGGWKDHPPTKEGEDSDELQTPSTDKGDEDAQIGSRTEAGLGNESGPAESNASKPAPDDNEKEEGRGKSSASEKPREDGDEGSMAASVLLAAEPKEGARIDEETTAAASDGPKPEEQKKSNEVKEVQGGVTELTSKEMDSTTEDGGGREKRTPAGPTLDRDGEDPSRPMEGIAAPGINDVLVGRTLQGNVYPCNAVFRNMIASWKRTYHTAFTPAGKRVVAEEVVEEWRSQDPLGRFLSYDRKSWTWRDVGDEEAAVTVGRMLCDHYGAEAGDQARKGKEEALSREQTKAGVKTGQMPRDTTLGSHPMKGITTPGINDFLLSRSPAWDMHSGNTVFQDLVKARKRAFLATAEKWLVAEEVVKEWRSRDPPGRFLSYDLSGMSGMWRDVGDQKAVKKAKEMLWDAILEYSAKEDFAAATPPVPLVGAARPSGGETGARTGRRKEPVVIDLSNSDDENEDDTTLDEALFARLTNLHQFMLRGELAPELMARAMDLQMNAIRQQREAIARKDAGIAKLSDLHYKMMAEKDAQISRMENEIVNFSREEVQKRAAGQVQYQNLSTMKLQMCTIDRQQQRINLQFREAIELGRLLAATTEEKDQEIRRLRDEVARAKGEGKGVKAEADREDSESEVGEGKGVKAEAEREDSESEVKREMRRLRDEVARSMAKSRGLKAEADKDKFESKGGGIFV